MVRFRMLVASFGLRISLFNDFYTSLLGAKFDAMQSWPYRLGGSPGEHARAAASPQKRLRYAGGAGGRIFGKHVLIEKTSG